MKAWKKVCPTSLDYPRRVDRPDLDLPDLSPGEKAIIAPIHPAVTISRNYLGSKKLRQESISLLQDPEPTWSGILPRSDLNKRFVVIQRTSNDNKERYVKVDREKVRHWLTYLFIHHNGFLNMKDNLKFSTEVLNALDPEAEFAEVYVEEKLPEDAATSECQEAEAAQPPTQNKVNDGTVQTALESGLNKTDVFSFDKLPRLYMTSKEFLRLKQGGQMELIKDTTKRVPIYDASASMCFPHLYSNGEMSPLDLGGYTLSRFLLKKQTLFAHKMADGSSRWTYSADDIHLMYQYARLVEQTIHANVGFYISAHPDAAHVPIESVLNAFKEGINDEGLLDSHMPELSAILTQMPNSREQWFSERLGLEAISRDRGDANLFLTQNMEIRAWKDVSQLLHLLEYGTAMPADFKLEKDTNKFTELVSKHAAILNVYLYRKAKIFTEAYLHDICRIPRKESGDYTRGDQVNNGWCWSRVEWTESRGVQHWHSLAKLPNVLDTALLGRMIQNGRLVRSELKRGNIKIDMKAEAWEIIEMGLLANRYVTLFADSISTTSFYISDTDKDGLPTTVAAPIEKYRSEFLANYTKGDVTASMHPLMRTYKDEDPKADPNVELARIAAVSCMHHCMKASCGGDAEGLGCRFDFPKRKLPCTVAALMEISKTQMEARVLLRRTCDRIPNLNRHFLRYWRSNHDVTVLIDASHKMRYATKYAAKSGKSTELLNEMVDLLQKRSTDTMPPTTKQVLSHLVLADCSHRAFVSKQELAYKAMDLPLVRKTFADVNIVGFYRRATLVPSEKDSSTIVYSDRTEYAAYAERCNPTTVAKSPLKEQLESMCLRDFAETVNRKWVNVPEKAEAIPVKKQAESTVDGDHASETACSAKHKFLKRDHETGHWVLSEKRTRSHIRWSTVLNTDAAIDYEPVNDNSTSFYDLPIDKRKQLYRAYMELVCYVPWRGSPELEFITDEEDKAMIQDSTMDPEKDFRYSLKRLEAFFRVYEKLAREWKDRAKEQLMAPR